MPNTVEVLSLQHHHHPTGNQQENETQDGAPLGSNNSMRPGMAPCRTPPTHTNPPPHLGRVITFNIIIFRLLFITLTAPHYKHQHTWLTCHRLIFRETTPLIRSPHETRSIYPNMTLANTDDKDGNGGDGEGREKVVWIRLTQGCWRREPDMLGSLVVENRGWKKDIWQSCLTKRHPLPPWLPESPL